MLWEQFGDLLKGESTNPPLEGLARLPHTDTLERTVTSLRAGLDLVGDADAAPELTRRLRVQLERAERDLIQARRRDEIAADRPAECWCLGVGGRGEAGVPVPTDGLDSDGRTVVDVVEGFREYCACPEGLAARQRTVEARAAAERFYANRRLAAIWSRSAIPSEYAVFTLDNYPGDPAALAQVRDWLPTDRWLILRGEYGGGKTSLLTSILRERAAEGRSILFVNAPALFRRVRSTYGNSGDGPTEGEVIRSLVEADVLGVDDLGSERMTEWATELFYDVVNQRYSEGRPMVVTTNLPLRTVVRPDGSAELGLEAHVGARTFWRLFERSLSITVTGNLRLPGARG